MTGRECFRGVVYLFSFGMFLFMLGMFAVSVVLWSWIPNYDRWVPVQAEVTESKTRFIGRGGLYELEVKYEYEVDGEVHADRFLRTQGRSGSASSEERDASGGKQWAVGKQFEVLYDPDSPGYSSVDGDPARLSASTAVAFFGGLTLLSGIIVWNIKRILGFLEPLFS